MVGVQEALRRRRRTGQHPRHLLHRARGARYGWNVLTEAIGTFVLVFIILLFGGTPSGLGPLAVALVVVVIGASLGGPTGYAINPARDLGPRIAHTILPIPNKAAPTGATRGCRSSAPSSAASSPASSRTPSSENSDILDTTTKLGAPGAERTQESS